MPVKQKLLVLALVGGLVLALMLVALSFCAIAVYFFLKTQIGEIYAALAVAAIALALVAAAAASAILMLQKLRARMRSAIHLRALSALGPFALRSAARGFGRTGPLNGLLAMGLSYWLARRRKR